MMFEELKVEAEKQGYILTKKIVYAKLKRCICGSKRVRCSLADKCRVYYCLDCKKRAKPAKYLYQARDNWNKFIEEGKK